MVIYDEHICNLLQSSIEIVPIKGIALRIPEFVRGDIISVGDKVIELQNCEKHVSGLDLETGKRFMEILKLFIIFRISFY